MDNIILKKLLNMESPFRWKINILEENRFDTLDKEIDSIKNEKEDFNFQWFIIKLVHCYEHKDKKPYDTSLEIIKELENLICKLEDSCNTTLFNKIQESIRHVLYSFKAFLLLLRNKTDDDEIEQAVSKVVPVEEMDNANQAGIYGIRSAAYFLYSYDDSCFSYINQAIAKDSENPYWHFLKGVYLKKMRKMKNTADVPTPEEVELFETALKGDQDNPFFMIHVADVYREITAHAATRKSIYYNFFNDTNEFDKKNKEKNADSLRLYKKSVVTAPKCAYILYKCAEGLLTLPGSHQNTNQAFKLLEEAEKINPDSCEGGCILAMAYQKRKEIQKAKEHLKTCSEKNMLNAHLNLIAIKHVENKSSNVAALENLLNLFKEPGRCALIYSQIVCFYTFVQHNLRKSCEYIIQFYKLNVSSSCLERHKPLFLNRAPFSLIEVVADEVKFQLQNAKCNSEVREFCDKFMHFMNFQNISVFKDPPRNLRNQILHQRSNDSAVSLPHRVQNNYSKSNTNSFNRRNAPVNPSWKPNARFTGKESQTYANSETKPKRQTDENQDPQSCGNRIPNLMVRKVKIPMGNMFKKTQHNLDDRRGHERDSRKFEERYQKLESDPYQSREHRHRSPPSKREHSRYPESKYRNPSRETRRTRSPNIKYRTTHKREHHRREGKSSSPGNTRKWEHCRDKRYSPSRTRSPSFTRGREHRYRDDLKSSSSERSNSSFQLSLCSDGSESDNRHTRSKYEKSTSDVDTRKGFNGKWKSAAGDRKTYKYKDDCRRDNECARKKGSKYSRSKRDDNSDANSSFDERTFIEFSTKPNKHSNREIVYANSRRLSNSSSSSFGSVNSGDNRLVAKYTASRNGGNQKKKFVNVS